MTKPSTLQYLVVRTNSDLVRVPCSKARLLTHNLNFLVINFDGAYYYVSSHDLAMVNLRANIFGGLKVLNFVREEYTLDGEIDIRNLPLLPQELVEDLLLDVAQDSIQNIESLWEVDGDKTK